MAGQAAKQWLQSTDRTARRAGPRYVTGDEARVPCTNAAPNSSPSSTQKLRIIVV